MTRPNSGPMPPGMFNPGEGTPVIQRPNVSQNYEGAEFVEKLFTLPVQVGQETEVFTTNDAHAALDVYIDRRFGAQDGPPLIISFEYIFRVYAITGQVVQQVAQGRLGFDSAGGGGQGIFSETGNLICSARSESQRFRVTCICVIAAPAGTIGISAFGYSTQAAHDPIQNAAPNGSLLSKQFSQGILGEGSFTQAGAQVFQFYGHNSTGSDLFISFYDSALFTAFPALSIMGEAFVPDGDNFYLQYTPPVWFEAGVAWRASLTAQGAAIAPGNGPRLWAQYR